MYDWINPLTKTMEECETCEHYTRCKGIEADSAPAADSEVFTGQQIRKFYRDILQGGYKGQESQVADKEKRIFKAMSEGRILA
jgi:hypothetical protein